MSDKVSDASLKLRALCEGLEIQHIDELKEGLTEVDTQRLKECSAVLGSLARDNILKGTPFGDAKSFINWIKGDDE